MNRFLKKHTELVFGIAAFAAMLSFFGCVPIASHSPEVAVSPSPALPQSEPQTVEIEISGAKQEPDITAEPLTPIPTDTPSPTPEATPEITSAPTPSGLLGGRYDAFLQEDGFEKSEHSYVSRNISIQVTRYDSSPLTRHLVYFVTDIHIQDVTSIRTESWDGNFGVRGEKLWTPFLKMARRVNAIVAINGDYYTYNIHTGLVIRNGERYQPDPWKPWSGHEILLLYRDGSMETFRSDSFDLSSIDLDTVWQAWEFGPSLLNENGTALSSFDKSYSDINRQNPRTVLGYYEPGHYCFVTIDGRKSGYSNGLTLHEAAQLMESLGCKIAFNIDGGQTTQLYWNDKMYNVPYEGGRFTSDIIYIVEPES